MAAQAIMMRRTHPAKGGKLNEMVCPRGTLSFYLCGSEQPADCDVPPHRPRRATANISLSFETLRVARVPLTGWTYSQSAAFVERQTTSYAAASGEASHVRLVSFSRFLVCIFTFAGSAGAEASDARVAAFSCVTCATYSKSTNFGRSPYSMPFSLRTF